MATSSRAAPALPAPFDERPNPGGLRPSGSTEMLVRRQVKALLASAPAFHQLGPRERAALEHHLVKVAAYTAECVRDAWAQSARLGQRPVRVSRPVRAQGADDGSAHTTLTAAARGADPGPVGAASGRAVPVGALAAGDEFAPAAADQIGRVTAATLQAISFPEFVADLIRGSFEAIVDSSIRQMEAYTKLLEDVSKTVDQFMADNITDNQARDWLVQRYPSHIALEPGGPRLIAPPGAEESAAPGWKEHLGLPRDVEPGDEDGYEETLVPAARRKLAQSRLQMLSTLVLMGIQRVIVTGGKIRATMAYHVDTTDRAAQQRATDFDFRTAASGSIGFGPWSAAASVSVGYVSSSRTQSESELDVSADLTGEVEIHFRSDVFPLSRFVDAGEAETIQANTTVPGQNPIPWGESPAPRVSPSQRQPMAPVRPIGEMPAAQPAPVAPTLPASGSPPPSGSQPSPPVTSGDGEQTSPGAGT